MSSKLVNYVNVCRAAVHKLPSTTPYVTATFSMSKDPRWVATSNSVLTRYLGLQSRVLF